MSIYAVKLSDWIDKKDRKNCNYYKFIKMFTKMKMKCKNPLCNNKLHYGMVDLHSAPFGMMEGPFCREACYEQYGKTNIKRKETSRTRRRDKINKQKAQKYSERCIIKINNLINWDNNETTP
jgi:hypothetical protein